jgi:hypothetical protein
MFTLAVKPQWVCYKLDETIEKSSGVGNISFGPMSHFVKILVCNLMRYCICSPYCWSYV